jgi:hypothetical protein
VLILERMDLEAKLGLKEFKAYDEALIGALKRLN